jgi:hypothetical protein
LRSIVEAIGEIAAALCEEFGRRFVREAQADRRDELLLAGERRGAGRASRSMLLNGLALVEREFIASVKDC